MNELIINNRWVDFSENTNIGITFCANNIGELQNRQGNFSNTFKLPITKINKEIFEWSHLQNSSSSMPYKKLKATYKQNGIEIVSDGVAEILNIDNEFFYVNVYSGNVDLMEAIGDITVGDLYKNDIVYNWGSDAIFNSVDDDKYYFIYPLIDWRKDKDTFFTTDTIDVKEMLPCLTMPKLFSRLSNYTGFYFSGNYLNSVSHKTMILTPNYFSIPKSDAVKTSQNLKTKKIGQANIVPTGSGTSIFTSYPSFRNENNVNDFSLGVFKPNINKIGKLKFAGQYDLFFKYSPTPTWKTINKKQAYIDVAITDVTGNTNIYGPIIYGPYDYKDNGITDILLDIETPEMTFLANTEYKVKIRTYVAQTNKEQSLALIEYDSMNPTDIFSGETTYPHYLQFTPSPKISFDTPLNIKNLFTMKVKDVLKDILNMNGIVIQTNNYSKIIRFDRFEDVILNKAISKNWSKKIQSSKSMSFKFGNYAKKNNVKFNNDTDNNWSFYLSNENLEVEKDVIKFNHDATFKYNRYKGFIIPTIDALKDSTNEWDNPGWRILFSNIQNTTFNVNYVYNTFTYPKNVNVPFCYPKDANTLIDENYNGLIEILKNPKVLKIVANLDITDITDLDFTIPIEINRPDLNLGGYFYINKIENYKGGLTSCEIIEI